MRKIKSSIAFVIALLFAFNGAFAQGKLSIDKVYRVTLRNSGQILENEQIKGYYLFYQSDKVDRKTNEYTLQILDANLNKLKDIKFQDSKKIVLLESAFNGSALIFTFFDESQNLLDYRLYNMDGKQTFTYSKTLDKKSEAYLKLRLSQTQSEEAENQTIFDIPSKGFLSVIPVRDGRKYSYEINFFASDKRRQWTYDPIEDGKFAGAEFLAANDSVAFIEVMKKDKLMTKETESTLLGVNLLTGKKAFEIETSDKAYKMLPMNISALRGKNEFIVMGPYYDANDRLMSDKSQGIAIWVMNNQGKILSSKYNSWTKDVAKFLKTDQKGRILDIGYVYFHSLLQTEDGKIFAIGEGYKKVANAVGIAASVLTQSYAADLTKLRVTDMVMIQLNNKFEITDARIFDKSNNSFSLQGADFQTPHTLALLAKAYGAFDYTFTQTGYNKGSFISGYTDYERSKDYKGLTFNSISYYDGQITTDKINLKTTASTLRILPAKPGSVLLMEYFRKDKRLDLRLEKMN